MVDAPLPTLTIPLNAGDALSFDFDAPYQQTYETLYFGDMVNYLSLLAAWSHSSADDQARILTRLLDVRARAAAGQRPAPLPTLPLTEAQRLWAEQP